MEASNSGELTEIFKAVASLAEIMGPSGVIALIFANPVFMLIASFYQTNVANRRIQRMADESRTTVYDLWEKHRQQNNALLEDRRKETADIIEKLSDGLAKTTRYYENNVLLVEDYNRLAAGQHDLIATNIRVLEQMRAGIEMMNKTTMAMVNK